MPDHQIHFSRAEHSEEEMQGALAVMREGGTAGGGKEGGLVQAFLSNAHMGSPTLLTTSCTHALEMAAILIGISPGDEVIIPSFGFVSVANAFLLRGARVRPVDIELPSLNLDFDCVAAAINTRTRAICVINYGGVGTSLLALRELADSRGIFLIEDNAHGLFGRDDGRLLGTFGHIATTSFHQTKNFSCGEGGAIFLNEGNMLEKAEVMIEKGTDRSKFYRGEVDKYTWAGLGSSWVLSDILASLLLPQLMRHDEILLQRTEIWDLYYEACLDWVLGGRQGVALPPPRKFFPNTGHVFFLLFDSPGEAQGLIKHLSQRGISAVTHYQALHRSPFYRHLYPDELVLPMSEKASDCLVRLPLHRALRRHDVERVIDGVLTFPSPDLSKDYLR